VIACADQRLAVATLLLSYFRGREDHVAVASGPAFRPHPLPRPLPPEWLAARHLAGEVCLGFYLMDPRSRVWCSCVDFDDHPDHPDPAWRDKAAALHLWLVKAGLAPLAEVSASGRGAHVWLFFDEPVEAWLVRAWWALAAGKAGVPLREVYPRQDELSGKGLGNLVRYPLWNQSRFADPEDDWAPLPPADLARVEKTTAADLRSLAFALGETLERPAPAAGPAAPGELPPRVRQRLSRAGSLLARRWGGDTSGLKDPSRSALLQSVATELVRQFVPTPEIEAALRCWCVEHDYEKGDREDWIARTVGKAYEFVFARVEERSSATLDMRAACHAYLDTLERGGLGCVPSGLDKLDASIDGLAPGEVAVIAARPGHGKSAFALQWLDCAALSGLPCLLVSEEMAAVELGKRSLCYIDGQHADRWRGEVPRLRAAVESHYAPRAPLYVVEACNSVDRVEDVIDQFVGLHGVRLVAVDYLQLLSGRGPKKYDQVSDVSRRLKQCARRNDVPLLALCQLNRELERRAAAPKDPAADDAPRLPEPQLSDLRDSGQLEQDADLVLFLQWPHRYDPNLDPGAYLLWVKKRRNGPIRRGKIVTTFDPVRQTIGAPRKVPLEPRDPGGNGHADANGNGRH
jgi:replicative DNA helicase